MLQIQFSRTAASVQNPNNITRALGGNGMDVCKWKVNAGSINVKSSIGSISLSLRSYPLLNACQVLAVAMCVIERRRRVWPVTVCTVRPVNYEIEKIPQSSRLSTALVGYSILINTKSVPVQLFSAPPTIDPRRRKKNVWKSFRRNQLRLIKTRPPMQRQPTTVGPSNGAEKSVWVCGVLFLEGNRKVLLYWCHHQQQAATESPTSLFLRDSYSLVGCSW